MLTFTNTYAVNPFVDSYSTGRRNIGGSLSTKGSANFIDDDFYLLRPDSAGNVVSIVEIKFDAQVGNVTALHDGKLTIKDNEGVLHTGTAIAGGDSDTMRFQLDTPIARTPINQLYDWDYTFELALTLFGGKQVIVMWSDTRKSPFDPPAALPSTCCRTTEYPLDILPEGGGNLLPIAQINGDYDGNSELVGLDPIPSSWNDNGSTAPTTIREVQWRFFLNTSTTPIHTLPFATLNTPVVGLGTGSTYGQLNFADEQALVDYLQTESGLSITNGDEIHIEAYVKNSNGDISPLPSNRLTIAVGDECCEDARLLEDGSCRILEDDQCRLLEMAA